MSTNMSDELGLDMSQMAEASAGFAAADGQPSSPTNLDIDAINELAFEGNELGHPDLESTVDVEDSEFWAGNEGAEEVGSDEPGVEAQIPSDLSQILKYKANGTDVELDLTTEEGRTKAIDALSRQAGMDKAFSESAQLKKQNKKFQMQLDELSKYRESWDKLEDLKHDRQGLLEFVTGESYQDFMNNELSRRQAYESGSDEERRAMDYEERMQSMEAEMRRDKESREREIQKAQDLRSEADYEKWNMWSQNELQKYADKIPNSNPVRANKLRKALWRESIADVKSYYSKYGKVTNKMVHKAFKDNADAMLGLYDTEVQNGVEKAIENKKVQAREKAQVASTKNYESAQINSDWASMDPTKLFQHFKKLRG